jgi:hypothetical protein
LKKRSRILAEFGKIFVGQTCHDAAPQMAALSPRGQPTSKGGDMKSYLKRTLVVVVACLSPAIGFAQWGGWAPGGGAYPGYGGNNGWSNSGFGNGWGNGNFAGRGRFCFDVDGRGWMRDWMNGNGWGNNGWGNNGWANNGWGNGWGNGSGWGGGRGRVCITMEAGGSMDDWLNGGGWGNNAWGNGGSGGPWRRGW